MGLDEYIDFCASDLRGAKVLQYTSQATFDKIQYSSQHLVVKFCNDETEACKSATKHFQAVSVGLSKEPEVKEGEDDADQLQPQYGFVEVDCALYGSVCEDNEVTTYPTVKVYDANDEYAAILLKGYNFKTVKNALKKLAAPPARPSDSVLYNEAIKASNANRHDEAISLFQELVRREPTIAQAHANLGNALLRMTSWGEVDSKEKSVKIFQDSLRAFAKALELDPQNGMANQGIAVARANFGISGRFYEIEQEEIDRLEAEATGEESPNADYNREYYRGAGNKKEDKDGEEVPLSEGEDEDEPEPIPEDELNLDDDAEWGDDDEEEEEEEDDDWGDLGGEDERREEL